MKKFNKYMSMAVVAGLGVTLFASCDDSKDNDFVSEYEGAPGIYFSNTVSATLELTEDANTVSYPVFRDVAGEELTVAVSVTPVEDYQPNDIYTFPSSVTFEAGSKVAQFVVGYDFSKAEIGVEQQYSLVLDAEPNPFSSNEVVITLVNPAPWVLLGTNGQYTDYGWGIGPITVSVWRQGEGGNTNAYRITNPYNDINGLGEDNYFEFQVLEVGSSVNGIEVTDPGYIFYNMYYMMYDSDNQDDIYLTHPAVFGFNQNYWSGNRVMEYQDDDLPGLVYFGPAYYLYNEGGAYNYPDFSPYIELVFPDYVSKDTTLEVTYEGIIKDETQQESVLLYVELGADITECRAAVGAGNDANAILNGIAGGSVDYITFTQGGNIRVPFSSENPTGNYTVGVVAYSNDEVKNYYTYTFLYVASSGETFDPNKGWKSLGYIPYTDGYISANIFLEQFPLTYYVEIQQNSTDSGLYRLVNPYGPGSIWSDQDYDPYSVTYINIDATDPTRVVIKQSEQNIPFQYEDGTIETFLSAWCLAEYFLENGNSADDIYNAGYYGTFKDNVLSFPFKTLAAYWNSVVGEGWSYANYILDWDKYESYGGNVPDGNVDYIVYTNPDGSPYVPFVLDFTQIITDSPAAYNTFTRSGFAMRTIPMSASLRSGNHINRKLFQGNSNKKAKAHAAVPVANRIR